MPKLPPTSFDAAYFRRYYFDRGTRVTTPREMQDRAALIAAVLRQARIPVKSVLDAGCGTGWLRAPFARVLPRAAYVGLEWSEYLCARYGWIRGSIADFAPGRRFDLVVCYDVLQYLDDRAAARAIANFARLASAALYVSALTTEDWRENCEQGLTDGDVHLRPAGWYRQRLSKSFRYAGLGVWIPKAVQAMLWELERCPAPLRRARGSSRRAPDARARPRRSPRAGR